MPYEAFCDVSHRHDPAESTQQAARSVGAAAKHAHRGNGLRAERGDGRRKCGAHHDRVARHVVGVSVQKGYVIGAPASQREHEPDHPGRKLNRRHDAERSLAVHASMITRPGARLHGCQHSRRIRACLLGRAPSS